MSNPVTLSSGIETACSVSWNPQEQKYYRSGASETLKCCLEQCKHPHDICSKYCVSHRPDSVECPVTCREQLEICNQTCQIIDPLWYTDNPYTKCLSNKDCGDLTVHDCIKKYTDELQSCCQMNCIPSLDTNCNKLCEMSELVELNDAAANPQHTIKLEKYINLTRKKHGWFYYMIIVLGLVAVCFGIWYILRHKLKKKRR